MVQKHGGAAAAASWRGAPEAGRPRGVALRPGGPVAAEATEVAPPCPSDMEGAQASPSCPSSSCPSDRAGGGSGVAADAVQGENVAVSGDDLQEGGGGAVEKV